MPDAPAADRIRAHVLAHYAATPDRPLYLAQLGSWLATADLRPPEGTRVSEWLADLLGSAFDIVVDPSNPVRRVLVPLDRVEWAREQFRLRSAATGPAHQALRRFPKSVLLAFVKHLEPGERIFIETNPPFKYQVADTVLGQDWLEVPPECRVQGRFFLTDTNSLSTDDAEALLGAIRRWCELIGRPPDEFEAERVPHQEAETQGSALDRLIRAQPPNSRPGILIPMDIVELLLRHK